MIADDDPWWSPERLRYKKIIDELFAYQRFLPLKYIEKELYKVGLEVRTFQLVAQKMGLTHQRGAIYGRIKPPA